MEVILREHVDNLGRRGEVVKVADGYARNYLLPRKLALLATDGQQAADRARARQVRGARRPRSSKVAEALAGRLAGVEIEIARKVGETEALYGSVTTADIAEALAAQGLRHRPPQAQLAEPIKKLGEYDVPLRLHRDVTVDVKVKVVAEGGAAQELALASGRRDRAIRQDAQPEPSSMSGSAIRAFHDVDPPRSIC